MGCVAVSAIATAAELAAVTHYLRSCWPSKHRLYFTHITLIIHIDQVCEPTFIHMANMDEGSIASAVTWAIMFVAGTRLCHTLCQGLCNTVNLPQLKTGLCIPKEEGQTLLGLKPSRKGWAEPQQFSW